MKKLRDQFAGILVVLKFLCIICFVVLGGFIGFLLSDSDGTFLGAILGGIVGYVVSICLVGFMATIVHISKTSDCILEILKKNMKNVDLSEYADSESLDSSYGCGEDTQN